MWPYIYNMATLCHAAMFHSERVMPVFHPHITQRNVRYIKHDVEILEHT